MCEIPHRVREGGLVAHTCLFPLNAVTGWHIVAGMRISVPVAGLLAFLQIGCGEDKSGPPCKVAGCGDAVLCESPADPAERGPWSVGAQTVEIEGMTVEIWYPAKFGSEKGKNKIVYDIRRLLPISERTKIPAEDNPWQECDCYSNLPLDDRHGPYPLLVFVHGTGGYRMQNLSQMTHWASRGFVVAAADHPGLYLGDMLVGNMVYDIESDMDLLLPALKSPTGEIAFLAGQVDASRIGMAGHSAGGMSIRPFGKFAGVRVLIPMAYEGTESGADLESSLIMGAIDDTVAEYSRQVKGYEDSPTPKRLVGIQNAGHLVFSDLCGLKNAEGQDLMEIAIEYQVANAELFEQMWDGCDPDQTSPQEGRAITNFATTAVFESVLHCSAADSVFAEIQTRYPLVTDYREAP
jgi:hypothetical protein